MATKSSLTSTRSPSAAKPPIGPVKVLPPVLAVSVPPPLPEADTPPKVTPYGLISQAKNAIQFSNVKVQRLKEGFEAVKSDLNLLVKSEEAETKKNEEGRFLQTSARKEAVVDTLFSHVKKAVFMADAQIDKFCFKRRGNYTQTECKKGVTAALEKMANDIWNSLMSTMDKPVSSKLSQSIKALNSLQKELDELTKGIEESLGKVEEALYEHCEEQEETTDTKALTERRGETTERRRSDETESVTSRARQPSPAIRKFREQFTSELQAEGQRMLNSFQRFSGNRKATRNQTFGLRKEMDDIMKDMVMAVQASYPRIGRAEDADTWRMKREVLRIKQRIDQLCKNMEDPEGIVPVHDTSTFSSPAPAMRLGRGGTNLSEDFDSMSEVSDRSRARSQAISASWDPEELKQEFSRQMKESQRSVISVIKEQHQSIATVSQGQSTLQLKQELLNADVAEIRRKLNDLFPGTQAKSKVVDLSKTIVVLKAFAPDIRASNDQEFMEKLTRQISTERQEMEAFMSAVRGEGYTFATLDDVAKEFTHLKESYASLREDHDEFLLKMIRTQSEYELEMEYHKSTNQQLQSDLQHLRDSMQAPENSEDLERIRTLEAEIEELKLAKEMQFEQLDEKIMLDDECQTDPVEEKTVKVTVEKIVKVPEKVYVEKIVEKTVIPPKPIPKIQRIRGLSIKGLSAKKPTVRFAEEAPEMIVFTQDFGPGIKPPEPEIVVEEGDEVIGVTEEHPQEMLVGSSADDPEFPSLPSDDLEPAEVLELREEINSRVSILKAITDEEQIIESKMAALQETSEFDTMRELSKSLTEVHKRYDEAFSEIENMQEKIEKLSPKKQAKESSERIPMQEARDSLAEEIRSLLDIHVPFEVCGTTTYAACEWALVRLADTYVWVRHTLPRPELSNEEMIAHCLEASYMMEPFALLPRHLVLATGYLLDLLKDKVRK